MLIRERTEQDLPALVESLHAVHEADGYPATWPADPAAWLATQRTAQAWVAEDGAIAGHLAVAIGVRDDAWRQYTDRPVSELIEIIRLFVDPRHRGRGVAGRLMQTAHDYAEERGLQAVLEVTEDESAAIALYESLGWQQVDTRQAVWTDAHGQHPMLRWYVARSSLIAF